MEIDNMIEFSFYRVQPHKRWWARTHQCEWTDCDFAVRAYTRPGLERKALRRVNGTMLGRLEYFADRALPSLHTRARQQQ